MSKLTLPLLLLCCVSVMSLSCGNEDKTAQQDNFLPAVKKTAGEHPEIPNGVKFRGDLDEVWTWKDKLGENILILSSWGPVDTTNELGRTYEVFAVNYYKKDTSYKVLWRLNDLIKECDLDWAADFLDGTTITDLDKDGIAETTVLYKLACRGDVSPADMKLIMHEDSVKYALRGSMWLSPATYSTEVDPKDPKNKLPITEKDVNLETLPGYKGTDDEYETRFGRYESEKEFKKAPPAFLFFARRQWLKYAEEKSL